MKRKIISGHLLALVTIFIWGGTFISTRVLLGYITPIEILIFRFALAYILIFLINPSFIKIKSFNEELKFFLLGLFGIAAYYLLENIALQYTLVSNVGFYMSATPILTTLITTLISKNRKFKKELIIGFILATTGIFFIIYNGSTKIEVHLHGDLLALSAAFSFSIYSVLLKQMTNKYNYLFITRKIFFYGLLILSFVYIHDFKPVPTSKFIIKEVYSNLLFLGIMGSFLGFIMWNKSIDIIGSINTCNYIYLVPVITAMFSILLLDEYLSVYLVIGGILTLSGVIISEKELKLKYSKKINCSKRCCIRC